MVPAEFRLSPVKQLTGRYDTLVYAGTLEQNIDGDWGAPDIANTGALFQWIIPGCSELPKSIVNVAGVLHAELPVNCIPPMMVRVNATDITTLSVGHATVAAIVGANGVKIDPDGHWFDGVETVIDLTSMTGRTIIFLVPVSGVLQAVTDDNLTVELDGEQLVYGNRLSDDTVVSDWESIQFRDGKTIVTFPAEYLGDVNLLVDRIAMAVFISEIGEDYITVQMEYPIGLVDNDYFVADAHPIINNGETQLQIEPDTIKAITLVPEWLHQLLIRDWSGVRPPPARVHTEPVVKKKLPHFVPWVNIVGKPNTDPAEIDRLLTIVEQLDVSLNSNYCDIFVLTEQDLYAERVTLTRTPVSPTAIKVNIVDGPQSFPGYHWLYMQNLNAVSWAGKGLVNKLIVGDVLIIYYEA